MIPRLKIVEDHSTIKIWCGADILYNFQKDFLSLHPIYKDVPTSISLVLRENPELLTLLIMQLREEGYFKGKEGDK